MKKLITLVFAFLTLSQLNAEDVHPAELELKELIGRINAMLSTETPSANTLATEIADFEALIEKYAESPE